MTFQREIGRVTIALLCGFFIVGLAAAYWSVAGPDGLLKRGDNPRLVLADQAVARGALMDSEGGVLAQSQRIDGVIERVYGDTMFGQVEGGFGITGVEALYDDLLRGEPVDPMAQAVRDLLHQPREGSDVMLTIEPSVQEALMNAMGDHAGAAVVVAIPGGEILGLVNRAAPSASEATPEPGADSTQTGATRALQAGYAAGGSLLPGLLSAALLENLDITRAAYPAGTCAVRLPTEQLISLQEAFLYGCVSPFEAVSAGMAPNALSAILTSFVPQPISGPLGDLLGGQPVPELASLDEMQAIDVSPLSMALMAAAIANDGSAPAPVIASGYRLAGDAVWTPLTSASPVIPVTTATTARRLQDLLRQAVAEGAAQNAGRPRLDIGGLVSLAGTDDDPVSWFTGFASLPDRQGAAVTVVLDGQRDVGLAADIGGDALEAAAAVLDSGS